MHFVDPNSDPDEGAPGPQGDRLAQAALLARYPSAHQFVELIRAHEQAPNFGLTPEPHPYVQAEEPEHSLHGPYFTYLRPGSNADIHFVISIALENGTSQICLLSTEGDVTYSKVLNSAEAELEIEGDFPLVLECVRRYCVPTDSFQQLEKLILPEVHSTGLRHPRPHLVGIHNRGLGYPNFVLPLVAAQGELFGVFNHEDSDGSAYLDRLALNTYRYDQNPTWDLIPNRSAFEALRYRWEVDQMFAFSPDQILVIESSRIPEFYTAIVSHPQADIDPTVEAIRRQLAVETRQIGPRLFEYQRALLNKSYGPHSDLIIESCLRDTIAAFPGDEDLIPDSAEALLLNSLEDFPLPELDIDAEPLHQSELPDECVRRWPLE